MKQVGMVSIRMKPLLIYKVLLAVMTTMAALKAIMFRFDFFLNYQQHKVCISANHLFPFFFAVSSAVPHKFDGNAT